MRPQSSIFQLCASVDNAIREVWLVIGGQHKFSDTMEKFWSLQDNLARLVEAADDRRAETFGAIEQHYPTLAQDVSDLLTKVRDCPCVAGVTAACLAIHDSLLLLEYFQQDFRTAAPAMVW